MAHLWVPEEFKCKELNPERIVVKLVGRMLLERLPRERSTPGAVLSTRGMFVPESVLEGLYPAAQQEYIDIYREFNGKEPALPDNLRQMVLDDLRFYLDRKGALL